MCIIVGKYSSACVYQAERPAGIASWIQLTSLCWIACWLSGAPRICAGAPEIYWKEHQCFEWKNLIWEPWGKYVDWAFFHIWIILRSWGHFVLRILKCLKPQSQFPPLGPTPIFEATVLLHTNNFSNYILLCIYIKLRNSCFVLFFYFAWLFSKDILHAWLDSMYR